MVAEEAKLEKLRRKMADYEMAIQRGQLTGSDEGGFEGQRKASEHLSDSSEMSQRIPSQGAHHRSAVSATIQRSSSGT